MASDKKEQPPYSSALACAQPVVDPSCYNWRRARCEPEKGGWLAQTLVSPMMDGNLKPLWLRIAIKKGRVTAAPRAD
ncbi:hypothetical protein [Thermosporothrix hazakensis]|uniref:hypothetical protein n=1 Tax=Thermosporothrix hazakensis TaxID=644383 RepID=UPI0010F4FA56|nr:hypothetical protein [Thermosporothrix hazakensis]